VEGSWAASETAASNLHTVHPVVSDRHDLLSDAVGCVLTLREVTECAVL